MSERKPFRQVALWICVAALAAGCIRSRSKLDLPRNPRFTHDLYDTLFPTRSEAGQFMQRMERKASELNALIGKVYTAPEWNVELEKIRQGRAASGLPPEEYKIHRGARFLVEVPQDTKLTRTYQVAPDGYIDVPHLGRVYVEGLTVSQFKAMMVERLAEIIRQPEVHVNFEGILSPGSPLRSADIGYIYIFGSIGGIATSGLVGEGALRATRVPYTGRETLFHIITAMGGVSENGAWDQTVVYRRMEDRKVMAVVSNLQLYVQRADFAQDFPLENEDVVYVPLQYSYTDDKIKGLLGYLVGWVGSLTSIDDAYHEIETRSRKDNIR